VEEVNPDGGVDLGVEGLAGAGVGGAGPGPPFDGGRGGGVGGHHTDVPVSHGRPKLPGGGSGERLWGEPPGGESTGRAHAGSDVVWNPSGVVCLECERWGGGSMGRCDTGVQADVGGLEDPCEGSMGESLE